MEEDPRLERKAFISGRKGDFNQGSGPRYPNLQDELFQTPFGTLHGD